MLGIQSCMRAREGWVDPITIGAVLLAVVSGAGAQLGTQLWEGVVSLVRGPFRHTAAASDAAAAVPSAEPELAGIRRAPWDRQRAGALAEARLARCGPGDGCRGALARWWQQAEPIRASIGNVG